MFAILIIHLNSAVFYHKNAQIGCY